VFSLKHSSKLKPECVISQIKLHKQMIGMQFEMYTYIKKMHTVIIKNKDFDR